MNIYIQVMCRPVFSVLNLLLCHYFLCIDLYVYPYSSSIHLFWRGKITHRSPVLNSYFQLFFSTSEFLFFLLLPPLPLFLSSPSPSPSYLLILWFSHFTAFSIWLQIIFILLISSLNIISFTLWTYQRIWVNLCLIIAVSELSIGNILLIVVYSLWAVLVPYMAHFVVVVVIGKTKQMEIVNSIIAALKYQTSSFPGFVILLLAVVAVFTFNTSHVY